MCVLNVDIRQIKKNKLFREQKIVYFGQKISLLVKTFGIMFKHPQFLIRDSD